MKNNTLLISLFLSVSNVWPLMALPKEMSSEKKIEAYLMQTERNISEYEKGGGSINSKDYFYFIGLRDGFTISLGVIQTDEKICPD